MDKALNIYTSILKEYLSMCFADQQNINPVELNKEKFTVKGVFIAVIIFMQNNPMKEACGITLEANYWFKTFFADNNLFSAIIEGAPQSLTKLIDKSLYDLMRIQSIDIPTFYETLFSIETASENNGTIISTAKNYRNNLGGYYTPAHLARAVTKKTIECFFELTFGVKNVSSITSAKLPDHFLKDLSTITFADFSCGSGTFLIEVIYFFEKIFHNLKLDEEHKATILRSITLNISAFDVDCLALEVAKSTLLLRICQPTLYKSLGDNFIHANFLLQSDNTVDEAKKIDLFSSGFIYHEQLALQKSKLKKYDVILGNPPWEKIRFEEKRFYALYTRNIVNNHFKSSRSAEIRKTELANVQLAEFSKRYKLELDKAKAELKKNKFFSLSHYGELNTFALFTDAAVNLKTHRGVVGLVLKSAIATSQVNQYLFKNLTKNNLVVGIYDFLNQKRIFNIDSRERFCFFLLGNSHKDKFHVVMNLTDVDEIDKTQSGIELSYEDLRLMNPFTGMLPNVSSKKECEFLLRISRDFPFFKSVFSNARFGRIVHLTNHAEFIEKKKADDNIPIYEGKFFNQFDGKYSGFNGVENEKRYGNKSSSVLLDKSKKPLPDYFPEARFFINQEKWFQLSRKHTEEFMLAWRSLTSATNSRTCIATVLPFMPATQSVQFLTANENDLLYLAGLFNSVVFDFILKKKLGGIDLTQTVINQIPVPDNHQTIRITFDGSCATIKQHLSLLVCSLLQNDIRLSSLFDRLGLSNQFGNDESRFEIIRKIDLLFMFLYKLNESEIELVLSAFSKQYTDIDLVWFEGELNKLQLDETVSSTYSASSTFSPV